MRGISVSNDKDNQLKVTGDVTTKALHDQHDKDGGTFGLSVGISERGTTAFNVRGGRAEQKHYNATQKSLFLAWIPLKRMYQVK